MKEAVAGELAAAYHSAIVDRVRAERLQVPSRPADHPPRARIRVLLRRRPRGRLRLPGAAPLPRAQRLPHRRNHPQPARERAAARRRHPVSLRPWREPRRARTRGRRHPPGLRRDRHRHGAARRARAARSSTRRAARCSTSGRTSSAMRRKGSPSVIHGKVKHEETRATASQALKYPRGRYLVVLDRGEAADRLRLHP